jgi:prolyl oligopeptidase
MPDNSPSKSKTFKAKPIKVDYPLTTIDTTIKDNYHGQIVNDPYRWLEDDRSDATNNWVKSQNQVTSSYLKQIPYREAIEKRLEKIWNYERYSTPVKEGGKYYYFKNDGLQNQSVLYVQDSLNAESKKILDPNLFSEDGTAALGEFAFSKNGNYLAYEISEGGSDWHTVFVKDLVNDKQLSDKVEWCKFSTIAWYKDGFFYSRYPKPSEGDALKGRNEFHQVFYHQLGTPQADDELIFADRANPSRGFYANTTDDEQFLIISVWESTSGNALYFKDLSDPENEFVPIAENFDSDYTFVNNIENRLLILTNYKADNNRLVAISTVRPEEGYWEEIIPENKDKLNGVNLLGGKIVANYIHNASSKVSVFDLRGKHETELSLPDIGTVSDFKGKKSEPLAFYAFDTFKSPTTIYSINMETGENKIFKKPTIQFDSEAYETKQVWYKSYDGTEIPMFVTHKKGLKLDGNRPTLLHGYGGFDISILPGFNTTRLNLAPIILENDGVFAVANIRGGGEFGKKWHEDGTKIKKQNVFNDFHAAAESLIDQGYTSPEKLAIYGRSNGGLLVGACMTQRPELYKVALPAVGVLDMLRYQEFTIGRAWASDYGLSENPKEFDYLFAYSPLHNIKSTAYPATMITTADHDDRVVPAHSFKFAATLQAHQQGDNPALIRIESSAGHGAGKPTSKKIEEAADILSFTFYNFGGNVIYDHKE